MPSLQAKTLPDLLEHTAAESSISAENLKTDVEETNPCDIDLMEELNVDKYLVWKPPEDDGPDIRGGTIDALIIQATKATKNGGRCYKQKIFNSLDTKKKICLTEYINNGLA